MSAPRVGLLISLVMAASLVGCGSSGGNRSMDSSWPGTPEPTGTRALAGSAATACAAGSTERFLEIQKQAPFAVYCPTYLLEGFQLKSASSNGQRLEILEGILGTDLFPGFRYQTPPPRVDHVLYGGDSSATLFDVSPQPESAVVRGTSPDHRDHVIYGNSAALDADTMRHIAERMIRLGPFATPPPGG